MAKPRESYPSADWTSLIDIIFQLLIFFMVTLALGSVQEQASAQQQGEEQADLPELPGMTDLGEALDITSNTLLIHVADDKDDKVRGDLVVYFLTSSYPSVDEAEKDSTHESGPFPWDVAYSKLEKMLSSKRMFNEPLPCVEMRATKSTPYGYVLDVMNMCYHDEEELRINQVFFRFARLAKEKGGG